MMLISGIREFEVINNEIIVDLSMIDRATIGLSDRSPVYVYPRLTRSIDKESKSIIENCEVIISPFNPRAWSSIWRIELRGIGYLGSINEIFRIFINLGGSILFQESFQSNHTNDFNFSLFVDFNQLPKNLKEHHNLSFSDYDSVVVKYLKQGLLKEQNKLGTNIQFTKVEATPLSLKFMQYENKKKFNEMKNNDIEFFESNLPEKYQEFYNNPQPLLIKKGRLVLNSHLLNILGISIPSNSARSCIQGVIYSDSSNRFGSLRLFAKERFTILLIITTQNLAGNVSVFIDLIFKTDPKFVILYSYLRISEDSTNASIYVGLDFTEVPHKLPLLLDNINAIPTFIALQTK